MEARDVFGEVAGLEGPAAVATLAVSHQSSANDTEDAFGSGARRQAVLLAPGAAISLGAGLSTDWRSSRGPPSCGLATWDVGSRNRLTLDVFEAALQEYRAPWPLLRVL
ncbi:hypothetical protein EYF80_013883 [Liparis tanakae]|uniref:Uncharacterized protein n=1 Tax=Liparis tanakae TaxID=230148 RepID=A0A4Z2IFM3_9TELE|nr:hypothetical protein EYF80_013883 [Liparis tanakae]